MLNGRFTRVVHHAHVVGGWSELTRVLRAIRRCVNSRRYQCALMCAAGNPSIPSHLSPSRSRSLPADASRGRATTLPEAVAAAAAAAAAATATAEASAIRHDDVT